MPKRPVEKTFTKTRIKKNDQVKVIAGRDKGKTGKVISVDRWRGKLIVEGVSMIKRHTRPNPQRQIKGGIAEKESGIAISNVMLLCPSCNKHARVGHKTLSDGSKVRVCKRCDTTLESK